MSRLRRNACGLSAFQHSATHHKASIMAGYVSEFTQFITELKAAKPQLEADQRKGRAIWWDKQPLDVKERSEQDAARVPQKPYPYSTN